MAEGDTLVNALLGAVVGTVLGFVLPFGPIFGGALAGYMQGGDRSDGLRIGALAGAIAFVPYVVIGGLILLLILPLVIGAGTGEFLAFGAITGVFVLVVLVGLAVYVVGLSAVGGWLGNYVKYDTDFEV